jgi:predicted small metal-binding protein
MSYQVGCRDLGRDCEFVAEGATIQELLEQGMEHGKAVHALTDDQLKNPAVADQVRAKARLS